jgi:hypothetical protein
LAFAQTIDREARPTKGVPSLITAAGNVAIWKKGIVEWEIVSEKLKNEAEAIITKCEAFLAATETVAVAIYDLVRQSSFYNFE